jgi:hypothetical protein
LKKASSEGTRRVADVWIFPPRLPSNMRSVFVCASCAVRRHRFQNIVARHLTRLQSCGVEGLKTTGSPIFRAARVAGIFATDTEERRESLRANFSLCSRARF